MKRVNKLMYFALLLSGTIAVSCTKEGPVGLTGENGAPGADANESCKTCHTSAVVDAKKMEYHYSMHGSDLAYEEGTRNACAPCHAHQGLMDVVTKNTPATFTLNTATNRYDNNYVASASALNMPGKIGCTTCHDKVHTNYTLSDFYPLTNSAAVKMTMWGGAKEINFAKTSSNMCAKCHQPRPVTGSNGNVIDYAKLISEPTVNYNLSSLSFRTGIHYGAHASVVAGVGPIELAGANAYPTTKHVHGTQASCATCHMATPKGLSGGHSFSAAGNYNGCNTTGCHTDMSATSGSLVGLKAEIDGLVNDLAAKLGNLVQKESDGLHHGYLNIYDAASNPNGYYRNPANGTPAPAYPAITNAQFAALINFQFAIREHSHGIHNPSYLRALLKNTIAAIPQGPAIP
jgi:hypothetical protein